MSGPTVSVVTVSYGSEPWLEDSVAACLASEGESVEVVLVDNGCTDGAVDRLDGTAGLRVIRPGANTGFAGGCNLGAAEAASDLVAMINPDALVDPLALHALAERVRAGAGIATACVLLADRPDTVNSAGNAVHFLGLSWSGGYNGARLEHLERRPVLAASGAAMAISKSLFDQLGGFEEQFFAYYEDADLSVRSWQGGHPVVYEPDARVLHRYEFSRNVGKYFLLERNRWSMLLTLLEGRTLALLAPMLLVQEVALWGLAVQQGWVGPKACSSIWLMRNWRWLWARRAEVEAVREVSDRALAPLYTTRLDAANVETPKWVAGGFGLMAGYWAGVQRLLGGRSGDACLGKRLIDD